WINGCQGFVGVGRVDHAVTLRAEEFYVFLCAALGAGQTMVLGELLPLERPAAETTRNWSSLDGHEIAPIPLLRVAQRFVAEVRAEMVCLFPHLWIAGEKVDQVAGRHAQRLGRLAHTGTERI